jgi:hypothetical protein
MTSLVAAAIAGISREVTLRIGCGIEAMDDVRDMSKRLSGHRSLIEGCWDMAFSAALPISGSGSDVSTESCLRSGEELLGNLHESLRLSQRLVIRCR